DRRAPRWPSALRIQPWNYRSPPSNYQSSCHHYRMAIIHEVLPVGMLGCNCSVIGDEISREAIVIDPGDDVSKIIAILDRNQLTVKMIVITHAHIDHIGGAEKLRAHTGAPVYMHEADKILSDHLDVQASWLGIATPKDPGIDK